MITKRIENNWRLRRVGEQEWVDAVVPGSVYTDLYRNKKIEDPYFKDNEYEVKALMENDYEYETVIQVEDGEFSKCDEVFLKFEGLDTLADIYLNDTHLGNAYNMHRIWTYQITNALQIGENTLRVVFHSPLKFMAEAFEKYGNIGNDDTIEGFMHLRKAHYMSGWDWGACLPDAGIFRPVCIQGVEKASLDSVYIRQRHEEGRVYLSLEPEVKEVGSQSNTYSYKVCITSPDGLEIVSEDISEAICIENPQLWWPNGIGEQPLYEVSVSLYVDGIKLDTWKRKIGLRTLTMKREKDEWGESFAHEINGKTIFAMGADYIPEEHLLGRTSKERTRKLLEDCKLANFNSIRVWGGGYYPEDWFFDLCDELGLLVWEDFMFACSVYELTPEFETNIRQEFIDNIKRIRHHASLALWCGNNEMEMFVDQKCWVTKPTEVRDYLLMYERIIPEVLREYDPETFYWPASPSSGGSFDFPNDPNRGDTHYWDVWHGNKPFSEYRKFYFRYASEFGFQAFPSIKTLETITDDATDLNPYSYVMEKHQRNYGGNGKISHYMQAAYRYPMNFSDYIYASQLLQADGIRYGVEHYRRNRGRCMGAVYWQLNDCWPVISWSSIDYYGRWKALHYYAKRFFAPVMISCEEKSWMTEAANMNRQHFVFEKSIRLNVTNETLEEKTIIVNYAIRNAKAEIQSEHSKEILVPALSSVWLDKVLLDELDPFTEYVSYEAQENGNTISSGTVIFSYPKYFKYEDPQLSYTIEGDEIIVTAKAYAKSVEILNEEENLVLEDNYFDMNAGEKRVKILRGNRDGIKLRSVYELGREGK
ncbi:MAG: glycoside hydrolase family 2 protein [Candidatus Ruminococcus intestinipullorum]|nr:glycoside hydrolase family 2 protein [Candidatus Ruminococcus intestinipullorum]